MCRLTVTALRWSAAFEGSCDVATGLDPFGDPCNIAGNLAISASRAPQLDASKHPQHDSHTPTMLFPSLVVFAAASSFISLAASHNIQMKAHQRECFHEALHKDDKMTVTFQVGDREFGGSGNLEVDFWVRNAF
jgi:hypothetical protein